MESWIIKYGGSFVIPGEQYDISALEELVSLVREHVDKQFIFVIGGGKLCRNINDASIGLLKKALGEGNPLVGVALDELGIAVTKINGRFVLDYLTRELGEDLVFDDIVDYPEMSVKTSKRVIIATGYKPGVSSDYDMMLLARAYSVSKAFKISNFPVVLDVKAVEFDKSKIGEYVSLPVMSWDKMLGLVGEKFIPGGSYPLDPSSAILGSELAKKNPQFTLFIGEKHQLSAMLSGKDFVGTVVKN